MGEREILTVGHSTHPIERFIALLRSAGVEAVADVRRYPASRHNPQFGAEALGASLADTAIGYEPFGAELGGRRSQRKADRERSPNKGWRSPSFRAYADHMASAEFQAGLARLETLAAQRRVAVMCAEAHPSRCHRALIADALTARGWRVLHLLADGRLTVHQLNPAALVTEGRLSYPIGAPGAQLRFEA